MNANYTCSLNVPIMILNKLMEEVLATAKIGSYKLRTDSPTFSPALSQLWVDFFRTELVIIHLLAKQSDEGLRIAISVVVNTA